MVKESIDFSDPIEEPKPVEAPTKAPVKKGRGTDLVGTAKQAVAGALTDVATGLPSLAAIIPSAIGAGYDAATTDKGFVESFGEHQQLPFMQGAMDITHAARGAVNKLFGIKEPVRTEDQIARLVASTFIPGVGWLGALANAPSKAAAVGRILTPVMKVTQSPTGSYLTGGNILRGGTQVGMGGAIDQTARHVFPNPDFPPMFSEEALTGKPLEAINFADDPNTIDFSDPTSLDAPVSNAQDNGPVNNTVEKLRAINEENDREENANNYKEIALIVAALGGSYVAKRTISNRMQIAADKAGPLGSASPDLKGADKAFVEIAEADGAWGKTKTGLGIVGKYLHTDWTDAAQHNIAMLRSKGVPEADIQIIAQAGSTDWKSVAKTFHWSGELGQGSGIKTHAPRALELDRLKLNNKDPVLQIGPDKWLTQRELYDLSEVARTDQTNRIMAVANDVINRSEMAKTEIPGLVDALARSDLAGVRGILEANKDAVSMIRRTLDDVERSKYPNKKNKDGSWKLWDEPREIHTGLKKPIGESEHRIWGKGSRLSDDMLSKIVDAADTDGAINALSRKTSETLDALLDYRVHMNELSPEAAAAYRRRFMHGPPGKERMAYIPMIHNSGSVGFWERMKNLAGIKTRKGEELNYAKELEQRGIGHGKGTDFPIHPLAALTRYADDTIEGVNLNTYQHHSLYYWTQMRHGKVGDDPHAMQYTGVDANGNITKLTDPAEIAAQEADNLGPQYLGYKPFNTTNDSLGDWEGFTAPFGKAKTRAFDDMDPNIMWTMQHGRLHAWKVPDAGLRASLDLHPALSPGQHFFRHWNKIFKAGTTGPLSAFAPVAHIFSAQQIAANIVGRTSKTHLNAAGRGWKSYIEGLGGTWDLLKTGWAKERADYLSQRIATQIGRGEMPNAARVQLRDRLEKAYTNSFMLRAQKETGRTAGYMGGDTRGFMDSFSNNEANFVRHVGVDQANLVWRMWKAWNHAWHEGPAYAQLLKHYGSNLRKGMSAKDKARLLRESADFSKKVAGDMRKVGASQQAKWFNAAVPFAPAMIQSWASIGGAIRANPSKFLTGVTSLIVAPTAAEVMWNFSMSGETFEDENKRKWTHNEYFWKGFNAQQRASTNIVMIPGKPPWEAHQFPVSPEWGLVRGFVIDSIDAVFNFSGTRSFEDLEPAQWNWVAGMNRVLDIAMPPPMAAAFTAITGKSVRGGFSFDPHGGDEEGEAKDISLTTAMPIGTGGRYTTRSQEDGAMDKVAAELIQDIGGSGGKLLVDVWNAATAGLNDRDDGSAATAFERGTEALGLAVNQQLKFPSLVFGRTSKLSTMQPASKRMFRIKETIKSLQDMNRMLDTGGKGDLRRIFSGNGFTNMMNDNAVWNEVAASISGLNSDLQEGNEEISSLRKDNNSLGMDGTKSVGEKRRKVDANNAALNDIYNDQYVMVKEWERKLSRVLRDRYKDETIEVNLEGNVPQSRLEGKSFLERLRTP